MFKNKKVDGRSTQKLSPTAPQSPSANNEPVYGMSVNRDTAPYN